MARKDAPGESPKFGQIPLSVALSYVDGQIGDPLGVPTVLAEGTRTQCAAGAGNGLVDRVFHDGADAPGQLRSAASALKEHGSRFALAGSYALWAYGAPEPSHDVDIVVAESDVAAAAATLKDDGFSVEHPPEDWLFKARAGEMVVDVLHRLNGVPVQQATLDCAEQRDVLGDRDAGATAHHGAHPKAAFPRRASLRLRGAAPSGAGDPRTAGLRPHQSPDRRQRFRGCVPSAS
jgi:hypothetical protein